MPGINGVGFLPLLLFQSLTTNFLNMAHYYRHHAAMNSRPAAAIFDGALFREPVLWKFMLLVAITYLVWSEKLTIVLDLSPVSAREQAEAGGHKIRASLMPEIFQEKKPEKPQKRRPKSAVLLPAGAQGQIRFAMDPGFATRNNIGNEEVAAAMDKCRDYVARFAPVAVAEMHKYGIPASVILAQGLLESDAGESRLARSTNNHFGMKCFSKRCKKGHCANFSDDSHKDFFVKYGNVWGSYRAHSQFLKNSRRYAHLFELEAADYRGWAKGLAKAGYATDKKYGEKLVALIQNLELDAYDRN